VFDDRYAEARAFAREIARFGVPAHALERGDVTALYERLDLAWRGGAAPIAGLTQFGPMFVIERLARERGMRVVLCVEHRASGLEEVAHAVSAHPDTVALAARLCFESADWPAAMAALAAHGRADAPGRVMQTIVSRGRAPALDAVVEADRTVIHYYLQHSMQTGRGVPYDGPLYSWAIAPRTAT
jgi:hypothetical protein